MLVANTLSFARIANSSTAGSNAAGVVLSIFLLLIGLVFIVAMLAVMVLWVITLIHVIQHNDVPDRTLWIVLHLIVGSIIGPIYWLVVKKPYDKSHHPIQHTAKTPENV